MTVRACLMSLVVLTLAAVAAAAPADVPPLYATTKVDGTDGVYIFRYNRHQSMLIVTPEGVIATDPIGLRRPAAKAYIEEIRKITSAPIKYVIYSHIHFDHIAGGQPFKDLGATFVAHRNAKAKIAHLNAPDVVVPDGLSATSDQSHLVEQRSNCSMSARTTPTARW